MQNYYQLPQLSNSNLSDVKRKLAGRDQEALPVKAFALGSYVDILLTEDESSVSLLLFRLAADIDAVKAKNMAAAFKKKYQYLIDITEGQKVVFGNISFTQNGIPVIYETRCKFDLYNDAFGVDIKTTSCNSIGAFVKSIDLFDYDRQAAFYMDTSNLDTFIFLGISKTAPHYIFKFVVKRGDKTYNAGRDKYQYLMYNKNILGL